MRQRWIKVFAALWIAAAALCAADPIPVTGRVVDGRGRALPGAQIELVRLADPFERGKLALEGKADVEPAVAVASDRSGSFSLMAPEAGMWAVRVKAPGAVPLQLDLVPLLEAVELPPAGLTPDAGLRVGVLDPRGRPIAGARVEVRTSSDLPSEDHPYIDRWQAAPRTGFTSADGSVVLPRSAEERLTVTAAASGFSGMREETVQAAVRLRLGAAAQQEVEVRDAQGRPVAGALVSSLSEEERRAVGLTGDQGRLTVDAPVGRELRLVAETADGRRGRITLHASTEPARITLAGPDRLAGRVFDRLTGKPLAGALVWPDEEPAAFVRTGATGAYDLAALPEGGLRLAAAAVRYLPAEVRLGGPRGKTGPSFALLPRRPAFGTVIDESGRPVAGAEVSLLPFAAVDEIALTAREFIARASSDPRGRFRIETVPAERVDLEARAPGFLPTLVRGLAVNPGTGAFDLGRVVLASGETLEGLVEDPQGQPVDGAVVQVRRADPVADRLARAGSRPSDLEAVSGADGRFAVKGLKPGEGVGLSVVKEGYASRTVSGLRVPVEEPVRIVLSQASRLAGRVLDESGAPIVAAQVVLRRGDGASRPLGGAGTTDGEGRFLLQNVEPGRFALDASAQGYLPVRVDEIEVAAGRDLQDLEVVLREGAAVVGTVTAPDGSPVAGAAVRALLATSRDGSEPLAVVPETRTGEDGRFRLAGLGQGRYSVAAEHPGYDRAAAELEIREDETRLDLQLGETWEVAGRVVDSGGQGVAGVRLGLASGDGSERGTVSGVDGEFRFAGIGGGRHRLRAEKQGYAPPPVREVQVAGGPVRGLEVRLDPGAVLTGQIRGLAFQDLARVQVAAARKGIPGEQSGRTDYQGRYRVDDLAPGDWIVLARMPDGRLAEGQLTVPAGAREMALDLEFEGGLTLSGRILAGNAPVAGAVVHARADDGSGAGGGVSGPQGEFQIQDLRPGTYELVVLAPQSGAPRKETLDLPGDRQVVIDLAAPPPSPRR